MIEIKCYGETDVSIIRVKDIAYGRLQAPDLDLAETFLQDFGMVRADRTKTALYMRGTGEAHHLHVTHLGEPRFLGVAFAAASPDDLERIARIDGASAVEPIEEPGGGHRVRLRDPLGYQVEIVSGIASVAPVPVARPGLNDAAEPLRRAGALTRHPAGPAHVKRIGHVVVMTPHLDETVRWYRENLGFLPSDDVYDGSESSLVGSFNRCDRGDDYVDHHVFFCLLGAKTGLNHLSFEVQDVDDVMLGHDHLKKQGYRHAWGIGRHMLGSQVFDYWYDPWGRGHEHWTDSDRLNARTEPGIAVVGRNTGSQWGPAPPREFMELATP